MKHLVAPSILSADFLNLKKEIEMLNKSEADWFHLDVMDGVFVPNITFGFSIIGQIKKITVKPLDVHLMIIQPERHIEEFQKAGADILTIHYEACKHLHRTIQIIHSCNMKAGVSLNPHTPVHLLENIINDIDVALIMSVNPGYGGQKFIENTYNKIIQLKKLIKQKKSHALIEVDGGVNISNAPKLIKAGADILVAGNSVFSSKDPMTEIHKLILSRMQYKFRNQ
ncbi:MAG: ribulose-phosphate 3-epimerase [Bacteroidia bacterium]|nr:ribulose-phosphate 3-epimerase [Bacteroidia bacterium]